MTMFGGSVEALLSRSMHRLRSLLPPELAGVVFLLVATTAFAQQPVAEIPFDSVPNFLKLPADINIGEASGVAVKRPLQGSRGFAPSGATKA